MKNNINPFDYAGHICKAMSPGILLTTKAGSEVNTMTIGWGMIGVEWGRPVFIGFVRESRHTRQLLQQNREFTINVPYGDYDKQILTFCGTKSGKDLNKLQELGLTPEEPQTISVPGIREPPLTLECRVVYQQDQELDIKKNERLWLLDDSKTWWRVRNAANRTGYVPSNYVERKNSLKKGSLVKNIKDTLGEWRA